MPEDRSVGLSRRPATSSIEMTAAAPTETSAQENDAALLALETRFNALAAQLNREVQPHGKEVDREALTIEVETILARLDPIERAIMETPACTIAGLGVKARHAAYVMSQYWEAPINQIDWDARAVRLLIEAVCDCARIPLPFRNVRTEE
jgi:hypothetical protein